MKTGGMVDMKKLKERGKDKYVQNRLRYKLTCTTCQPGSWGLLQLVYGLKCPLCSVKSMLFKSKENRNSSNVNLV